MAQPRPFAFAFNRGMRQDEARDQMVRGAAWNLIDYIPSLLGAALVKRGGWAYSSPDLSTVKATAGYVQAVVHAPFTAGAKLCAIDEDGELYTVASTSSASDIGAAVAPSQVPVFHRNRLIIPASNGTTAPKTYDGTTLGNLAGSPPAAIYAGVYKDRTLLGNTSAQPQRLSFSDAGNPQSWNAAGYIDASQPITGIASMRSAVLVFHTRSTERIRGATPPPNTDMVLEPLFDRGCIDARSIATYGEFVLFANLSGVCLTDGSILLDLTKAGGISRYWQNLLASWTTSYTISAGVFRGHYIVAIMNGSSFVDCLVCDIEQRFWYRIANTKGLTFAPSVGTSPELYFGLRSAPRVCALSGIWSPAAGNKNDGDGTAVTPVMETQFTPLNGLMRLKHAYLGYDLRDAASDNPILTLSLITSPEATSYTALTDTFAETAAYRRARAAIRQRASGFGFKVTQANASQDTRLYGLELEGHELEKSRRA